MVGIGKYQIRHSVVKKTHAKLIGHKIVLSVLIDLHLSTYSLSFDEMKITTTDEHVLFYIQNKLLMIIIMNDAVIYK